MRNTRPTQPQRSVRARTRGLSRVSKATAGIALTGGAATLTVAAGLALTRPDPAAAQSRTTRTPATTTHIPGGQVSSPPPSNTRSSGTQQHGAVPTPRSRRQHHHTQSHGS